MFGLEIDEHYETPLLLQRFMICACALSVVVFHPLVTYLLLFRSKGMNEDMRRGFFLLRISQILLDVLFGLLFQPYPLTPLPVFGCMGLLCDAGWLPPVHMFGILGILINGTVVIYLSLLLHIQQTLIVGESRTRISSRLQCEMRYVHFP
ncbi:hypothetical protein PMAYCL1PPCAC_26284 [Pristionchus mayeri]|uniref:G protein-coupled receptor n=1 Tax=Pristionchus mayeri TaxID=1317129 RepID=A0AAN5D464_9BILA|nr:hypothetical protein PMAYCL1PPCAC_26284 [Pristionchus mayeri]